MGTFVKGDIVILPFPFSDLSSSKKRPALILATLRGDDVVLCQITSKDRPANSHAIAITDADFVSGGLKQDSNIRPERVFTADSNKIEYKAGNLKQDKVDAAIASLIKILQQ